MLVLDNDERHLVAIQYSSGGCWEQSKNEGYGAEVGGFQESVVAKCSLTISCNIHPPLCQHPGRREFIHNMQKHANIAQLRGLITG